MNTTSSSQIRSWSWPPMVMDHELPPLPLWITSLSFTADGRLLVGGYGYGTGAHQCTHLYDPNSWNDTLTAAPTVSCFTRFAEMSPQGHWLAVATTGGILLWDVPASQETVVLHTWDVASCNEDGEATDLASSPDGPVLFAAGLYGRLQRWELGSLLGL